MTNCYRLHHGRSKKPILEIVADSDAPGLWRIAWPDIGLSDRTNLTRAKAAALEWAETSVMTERRKMSGARRLKPLNNFSWSGSYIVPNWRGVTLTSRRMTRSYPPKKKLQSLAQLDGRTSLARQARDLQSQISTDLGGDDHLSAAQRVLIQRVALLRSGHRQRSQRCGPIGWSVTKRGLDKRNFGGD
jgi:hypothetical protein